jgi:hypothetical protein
METIWMGTNENFSTHNSLKPSGWQPMETIRLATNGNHPAGNQWQPSGWQPMETIRPGTNQWFGRPKYRQ